jgi:hypothetical protein
MRIRLMAQRAALVENRCTVHVPGARGKREQAKQKASVLFSEEKNQKTFIPAQVPRSGTWPESGRLADAEMSHPSATPTITETVQW